MNDLLTARTLRFERLLDAPADTVWRYLVETELRSRWFMAGTDDLRPGGTIGFKMDHDRLSDEPAATPEKYAGVVGSSWNETVTKFDPPRVLAFTWDGGANGEVTITLEPLGRRTRLTLVHDGIRDRAGAVNFAGGWGAHLAVLERRLRGERVEDFWVLHAAAESRAEAALP